MPLIPFKLGAASGIVAQDAQFRHDKFVQAAIRLLDALQFGAPMKPPGARNSRQLKAGVRAA